MESNNVYFHGWPQFSAGVALLVLLHLFTRAIYNIYFHPLAKFPGPALHTAFHLPYFYHLMQGHNNLRFKELHDKYGSVVRYRPNALSFLNAPAWKDIYGTRLGRRQLEKDPEFYTAGQGPIRHIGNADDINHARIRKLLAHAFSDAALREQEPLLKQYFGLLVTQLVQKCEAGEAVDMTSWFNYTTFDIIGDLSLGESFGALARGSYHSWMKSILAGSNFLRFFVIAHCYEPLLTIVGGVLKIIPSIRRAGRKHWRFTMLKTTARLESKTDRKDFMHYIQRHNDNRGMTNEEIVVTTGVLMIAGSETTATLLSGAQYFLLFNRNVYDKVKKEVRQAFSSTDEITLTSTARLPYLQAVLQESLRMYPPVSIGMPRKTGAEGDMIDGHFIPGETVVSVPQYAAGFSERSFADPTTFAPERWMKDAPEKYHSDSRDAIQPFLIGPRGCLGKNLAYGEMRCIMAQLLWHFDMEAEKGMETWIDHKVYMFWEKPPLMVKLKLVKH